MGRRTIPALIADLSLQGMRLLGAHLPPVGAWVSMSIVASPCEISATGHVMWSNGGREIGIELGVESVRHHRELRALMLAFAFEAQGNQPAAALLVDDPAMAARLCEPLRRHGYLPAVVTTLLEATACLARARPAAQLAIVSPRAIGLPAAEVVEYLAAKYPTVARILIGDPDGVGRSRVDEILSLADADHDLDLLLDEVRA